MVDYLGLILIGAWALSVWVFLDVLKSASRPIKIGAWALILLVPIVGFLAWFIAGPRAK